MNDYYSERLSSNNLKRCYEIAPPRVQQYLESEMNYVLEHISKSDSVIELGCGYGRVLRKLLPFSSNVIGIDTSLESLKLATAYTEHNPRCQLFQASAERLSLPDNSIDKVVCIQNGISAFKVDPIKLISESVRITRSGGMCLFSSYSDKFWESRLDWFRLQAVAGLIGEIDWTKTSNGIISCKDGFKATTFTSENFQNIVLQLDIETTIIEVDESSIFCNILI